MDGFVLAGFILCIVGRELYLAGVTLSHEVGFEPSTEELSEDEVLGNSDRFCFENVMVEVQFESFRPGRIWLV